MIARRLQSFVLVCVLTALSQSSEAATIIVTTTADDVAVNGNCTLREAIIAANSNSAVDGCAAGGAADTIILPSGVYVLTVTGPQEDGAQTGDLDVASQITILGAGPSASVIDGGSPSDYFLFDRVIDVTPYGSLTLSGVGVRGGVCYNAGGILNAGELVVIDSLVSNNVTRQDADSCWAAGAGDGGAGIVNLGTGYLVMSRSTVLANQGLGANGPSDSSAIGGGLKNFGVASLVNTLIEGNFAAEGGGLWNVGGLEIFDSQISYNASRFRGAAMSNVEDAYVYRTAVVGNSGGTIIRNGATAPALLRMLSSTISGNYSYFGITVEANSSTFIEGSTIANNGGSGSVVADIGGVGPTQASTTLISSAEGQNCQAAIVSLGYNITTDASCGMTSAGDLQDANPLLGALADNGGFGPTHALQPGSPAIDRIPNAQCHGTDQRVVARPQPFPSGQCDVGAYEFTASPVVTIVSPTNGLTSGQGRLVLFTGKAIDAESGNLTSALAWTSSLDGVIGGGAAVSRALSAGTHVIVASVTDSSGRSGSASVTVYVTPDSIAEGTFVSAADQDGLVVESAETSNVGGLAESTAAGARALRIGDFGANQQVKTVVSFDTSAIPDGATIVSATLRLRRGSIRGTNPFSTHGTARVDIRQGGFGASASLEAADFQAVSSAAAVGSLSNPAANGDWAEAPLDAIGLALVNRTGLTQLRLGFPLDDDNDNVEDTMTFYSGNEPDAASRPQLLVAYSMGGAGNTAPSVTISQPANGSSVPAGTLIAFAGEASDAEDGSLTASLTWTSDRDGVIGGGGSFSRVLSAGAHMISAAVVDSGGLSGQAAIAVTVNPVVLPPAPPTNLVATSPAIGRIHLVWADASTNETGFDIGLGDIDHAPPDLTLIGSVGADITTWDWTTCPDPGVSHHWYVRAVNAAGPSAWFGPIGKNCDGTDGGTQATFTSIAVDDGLVAESGETSNVGGLVESTAAGARALRIGDFGANQQVKTVVSFDTSAIPDGATVVSATLRLRRGSIRGANPFTTHGTALVDIRQGAFGTGATLEAGDFQAAPSAASVGTLSSPAANGDWAEASLNATGLALVNRAGLTQLRVAYTLDDDNDSVEDTVGFYSGNEPDAASRPQLVVAYSAGGGNTAPTVTITQPANGVSVPAGTSIAFAGTASDVEDGNLTPSLTWSSDRDGTIGSGGGFSYVLSVGAHVISASVADSGALSGQAAIAVTVNPVTLPPTPPTNLVATSPTVGRIHLVWTDASTNETGFEIGRGPGPTVEGSVAANVTSWDWTTCTDPSTTHEWYVRSVNEAGGSPWLGPVVERCDGTDGATQSAFTSLADEDGVLIENGEASGIGGSSESAAAGARALRVGDLAANQQVKTMVSFDTSAIPDGATLVSATLRLRRGSIRGTNPFTTHGTASVDIRQGAFGSSAVLEAADFQAAPSAGSVGVLSNPAANGDWAEASLNAAGLALVNRTGLTQLRIAFTLDDDNDSVEDTMTFYSGNEPDAASRPQLVVTYSLGGS